ncbi:MAG: HAMP domain-containing sensor histidine kinase [Armatimonadia bacterium]
MMTEPPPRTEEHFGPVSGTWRTRTIAFGVALVLIVFLEALQHTVLMSLSYTSYHLITGLVQAAIIVSLIFVYLRWRRHAERAQHAFEHLREAESLRDDMSAMLIHDLKNPLISASMALQNVVRRQHAIRCMDEDELELLDMARQSQLRLLGMIGDLLDIARAEEGKLQLSTEPVDLCEIAKRAIDEARGLAERANLSLSIDCPNEAVPLTGDRQKLRRVADNLLTNAIKFTPSGGSIWVRVWQEDSHAHLQVRDTGPGIPAEMHEAVFDKFTQARSGIRYSVGLGLTFSKYAAEAHGGTIKLQSAPGQGSTFTVKLPQSPAN